MTLKQNGTKPSAMTVTMWRTRKTVAVSERLRWSPSTTNRGQRVPVRRHGRNDEWMFLAEVVELPPLVWVVLTNRVRAAG